MTLLDPHLDIEQVSAAVDGERDPSVAAHLLTCMACRSQVDAWRRALRPLRDLPAVAPDADAAIEAALASWSPADPMATASSMATVSSIASLSPRPGAASRPASASPAAARWRRLRPPPAAAAVLVLVVLIAAAVFGLHRAGSTSSSKSSSQAVSGAAAAPLGSGTASSGPTSVGGAASGPVSGRSSSTPAASPATFAGTAELVAQLRAALVAHPAGPVAVGTPCLSQARQLAARTPAVAVTSPVYAETVRLAGVAGRVFVFPAGSGQVAVVVRSDNCALLATIRF